MKSFKAIDKHEMVLNGKREMHLKQRRRAGFLIGKVKVSLVCVFILD